ncbi:MAG: amidohydrolase [Bacteroidota bacterium]|nr:amidohydrolase [Bacteroidota bacterium]
MKYKTLNIALYQADLAWEQPKTNVDKLWSHEKKLHDIDLLVCPEMFTTGFSMNVEKIGKPHKSEDFHAIADLAKKTQTSIVFSMIVCEAGMCYNRLYFIFPDGSEAHYDKKHLFRMGDEHHHYSAGHKQLLVDVKGWRIMPLVCYDLRFPVWSRNTMNYDLLIYVANWPAPRADVWKSLLIARALENQAYVVGVNRIGKDGRNLSYQGDSLLFDAKGNVLLDAGDEEKLVSGSITKDDLMAFRKKFPVLKDRDNFRLTD